MKTILKKGSFYFLFVIAFIMQASISEAVDEVHFSGGQPLDAYQPKIIVPLLKEAFKRNGVEFYAKHYPSLRSLKSSNSGKTDGEIHRVYHFHEASGGKYPNLIRIESQLLSIWSSVFVTKDLQIKTWDDLKGYDVAYTRGRKNIEKILGKRLVPKNIHSVANDTKAFGILIKNRVDVVVSESRKGNRIINSNPKFKGIVEVKIHEVKIYSFIHKKHKKLAVKVAETLEAMKKDGTFSKIFDEMSKDPK